MRPLVVALAGAACYFAVPASAQPHDSGAALNWSRLPGAEACPSVVELARRVGVQLKRDAFVSPANATVLVDVTIQPAERGFRVRILLSSNDQLTPGERELASPSPDCNDAVDSAALAIALMLDPNLLTRDNEPEASARIPAATASASAAPVLPLKPAPLAASAATKAPAQRPRGPGRTQLAAGALGAIDQVPGTSFGVAAGLRRANQTRSASIDFNLFYLAPRRLELRPQAGGQFSLLGVGLSPVWSPFRRGPWVLSLLTGAQIARMLASGFGFSASNRDAGSWLVSGTLEVEAAFAISQRWELLLRVGGGVPVWRDTFEARTADGVTVILDPPLFFGTLRLALAFSP